MAVLRVPTTRPQFVRFIFISYVGTASDAHLFVIDNLD
jgi:hypothetical protein